MISEKTRAHNKVWNEIKYGRMVPARERKCQHCGKGSDEVMMEYHHPDYSKPLEVIPLCKLCHDKLEKSQKPEKSKPPLRFPQKSNSEAIKKSWVLRKKQSSNGHNIY